MKKISLIASAVIAGGLIIGCGSGSDSGSNSNSTNTIQTGTFIDAPVAGLEYNTSSGINGVTDENGHYNFKDGDKITFKLGNVILGETIAKQIITPLDIANNPIIATRIAYILQNLDTDGNANNDVIKLPKSEILKKFLNDINMTDEANVTNTVSLLKDKIENSLNVILPDVSIIDANQTMINNINNSNIDNNTNNTNSNNNVTVATGFPKGYLNGKTFYLVHEYTGDPSLEKYGWVDDIKLVFDETKMYIYPDGTVGDDENEFLTYSVNDNGELVLSDNTVNKVVEVTNDYIKLTREGGSSVWLFFDKAKADEFLNKNFSYSDIPINKTLYHISSENGIDKVLDGEFTFVNKNTIKAYGYNENKYFTFTVTYKNNNRIAEIDYKDGTKNNCFIQEKTKDYIYEKCYDPNDLDKDGNPKDWDGIYLFFDKEKAQEFVNQSQTSIDPKTLKGKILYRFSGGNSWSGIDGLKLNDNSLTRYWINTQNEFDNIDLDNPSISTCNYNYTVNYLSNNMIELNGKDCDGEEEDIKMPVYEIDLAGKKVDPVYIYGGNLDLLDKLDNPQYITFTKGKAYCYLLWEICWFDKDAIENILNNSK